MATTTGGLSEEDYVALTKGGNHVLNVQKYWNKIHHTEDQEQYISRMKQATYKNHCKKIINSLVAYTLGSSSEIRDEEMADRRRVQTLVYIVKILRQTLIRGAVWVLGLEAGYIIFPRSNVEFNKETKTFKMRVSDTAFYLYNIAEETLTRKAQGQPDEVETGFNSDLFCLFTVNEGGESVLVDAAQQSIGINSLRSVVDVQAYRTLKYILYGPSGANPDQNKGQLSAYVNNDQPGGGNVGVIQLNPEPISRISELIQERTLELATDTGMVEEFSTELKAAAESGHAITLRKAELTALVNMFAAALEDKFNVMQKARFDSYGAGIIVEDGDINGLEPNFIRIKAKVMKAETHGAEIAELESIARTARTDEVVKEVQKLVVGFLPLDEDRIKDLRLDIDEKGGHVSFQNSNLINAADIDT